MIMTKRDIVTMVILSLITFGLYLLYWTVVTKNELNRAGGNVPTAWLFIVPFANFYFIYKFCQAFATIVLHDENQTVPYFLLFCLLMPIAAIIFQLQMNKAA